MDNKTNISQLKREKMLNVLSELKNKIDDEEVISSLNLIENELTKKKYGLVWEEHAEEVDDYLVHNIPSLIEDESKRIINDGKNTNFLIEGDNLHSLYLLEKTHKNKIDVIYIDPPYNTGKKNEWRYNDSCVDENDGFRHSKWLSFMYRRLVISKKLLKNDGFICISIDDNELYPLKLLCDEIFDESNYICTYVWQKNFAPKNDNKYISTSHEYILMYAKNKFRYDRNLVPRSEKNNSGYSNPDNDPRGLWTSGTCLATTFSESGVFEVVTPNGKKHMPPKGRCWRYSQAKFEELFKDNRIWLGKDGNGVPRVKRFLSEMPSGVVPQTWLKYEEVGSGQDGTKDLKNIFDGEMVFNFPKPVKLIKFLIDRHKNKDGIILDFFAGTGTTGQAVNELNLEDGGNRKFILCTNNENNICEELTYTRLKKSNTKELIYYKTSSVPKINNDDINLSEELLENINNLIQLENHQIIDNKKIKIFYDEEELDNFCKSIKELEECDLLYISSDIFLSTWQDNIFSKYNIKTYIIPEYYFKEELMEVE
jgi:adenine-specific DNA-methyltransferase